MHRTFLSFLKDKSAKQKNRQLFFVMTNGKNSCSSKRTCSADDRNMRSVRIRTNRQLRRYSFDACSARVQWTEKVGTQLLLNVRRSFFFYLQYINTKKGTKNAWFSFFKMCNRIQNTVISFRSPQSMDRQYRKRTI